MNPRCPGESYDLTPYLCRARQAKAYEKCPGCPHQGVQAAPEPAVETMTVPAEALPQEYGNELASRPAPEAPRITERVARLRHSAAATLGAASAAGAAGAASLHGKGSLSGVWAAARRIYDFF